MDFDYNTMYKKYFNIYESCKRKYNFLELKQSEFKKLVIQATEETLKEDNEDLFNISLRDNLDSLLRQTACKMIRENQYYYLNKYFNSLIINGISKDNFLKVLESIVKFLNAYNVKISEETATELIKNNINVKYIIRYCYAYNFYFKRTNSFKDYNINALLFWHSTLKQETLKEDAVGPKKPSSENKNGSNMRVKEQAVANSSRLITVNKGSAAEKSVVSKNTKLNQENIPPLNHDEHHLKKSRKKRTNVDLLLNKSLYSIFSEYSADEVRTAYNLLSAENKKILSKLYNADLEPIVDVRKDLTGKDRAEIKRVIYYNMLTILKRNRGEQPFKTNLYYRFKGYLKEEILEVIKNLPVEDQCIIGIRFDSEGNYKNGKISRKLFKRINYIIRDKIPRRLKKIRFNRLTDFLCLYYYNAYSVEQITEALNFLGVEFQDNLYQSLDFTNGLPTIKNEVMFKKCIAIFDMHIRRIDKRDILILKVAAYGNINDMLTRILLMKLGLLDGRVYSDTEISALLEISFEKLEDYKETLRQFVNDLQAPTTDLKRSLKQ